MDKNEILEMSREENRGKQDEREKVAFTEASKIGMIVGDIICAILTVVALIVPNLELVLFTAWTVSDAMFGTQKLVFYTKTKKKNDLISGIMYTIASVACLAGLIYFMVANATI